MKFISFIAVLATFAIISSSSVPAEKGSSNTTPVQYIDFEETPIFITVKK